MSTRKIDLVLKPLQDNMLDKRLIQKRNVSYVLVQSYLKDENYSVKSV